MTKPIMYVTQDGKDFYCHRAEDMSDSATVWSAPFAVRDFDLPAANRARERFMQQAEFAGWEVKFPNPFGEA